MASPVVYEICATLYWEIENFDLLLETDLGTWNLRSPVWKVHHNERNIYCTLVVCHVDRSIGLCMSKFQGVSVNVRCDVSIISSCGEVPLIKDSNNGTFSIEKDTVFGDKKQSMLPNNMLTLRWRMLGETKRNQELRICTVLHSIRYLWNIQPFNSSSSYTAFIEKGNLLLRVALKAKNEGVTSLVVEIVPYAEICASFVDCALSTTGFEIIKNKTCIFPYFKWSCDIENFPENKKRINAQFRSIVSLHKVLGPDIVTPPAHTNLKRVLTTKPLRHSPYMLLRQSLRHKISQIVKHENASDTLSGPSARADDFLRLYREGTLSDATLNTEGKSFLAHRSILAARSPVFRAMFEKGEMSEGRSGVVDIDDVDSETVGRMLVFLYGEKLDDVQWEEASELYYAADKYDVPSLKRRCVDILKAGVAVDNACDLLVLADSHSDEQLRKCVVDFISDHREVFSSSKWEMLEESDPRLTTKILREVYVKKEK